MRSPVYPAYCVFLLVLRPTYGLLNISLTDQSPLVTYDNPTLVLPNGTASALQDNSSWVVEYSGVSLSAYDPDQFNVGLGQSSHWTEQNEASATIQFSGDGIYAWGNITDRGGSDSDPQPTGGYGDSYISVNGRTYSGDNGEGCLGYATGLGQGWHTATLEYKGQGRLTFTGFTLELDLGGDMTNSTINVNGTNGPQSINQAFSLSANDWGLADVSSDDPENYQEILTTHRYASLSFEVPTNTSAIILWGNVSPVDGNYSVTLSSPTVNDVQKTASSLTPPANQTFFQPLDSLSPWQGINVIQYLRVLNPKYSHTIKVDKLSDNAFAYGLNGVTLISATNTTVPNDPSNGGGGGDTGDSGGSGVDAGAIAGGVVGGLAALALIIGLIWFFMRRKKRQAMTVKPAEVSAFEVDENGYADRDRSLRPEAFPVNAETAYSQAAGGTDDSTLSTMTEKQAALLADHTPPNSTAPPSMTTSHHTPVTIPTLTTSRSSPAQPAPLRLHDPSSHDSSQTASESTPPIRPAEEPKPPGTNVPPNAARRRRRPAERELVQEVDAGRVEPDVERLPPSYDPTWSRRREGNGESDGD